MHPVKTITTGEGGLLTTNNLEISKKVDLFRNHGIKKDKINFWKYDVLNNGYNYRISDVNCALGLSQFNKINYFLNRRRKIYLNYYKELSNFNSNLVLPKYSRDTKPSCHLFLLNINFKKLKKKKMIL